MSSSKVFQQVYHLDSSMSSNVPTGCVQVDAREDGEEIARKSVELLLQDSLLQISFQQEQAVSNMVILSHSEEG